MRMIVIVALAVGMAGEFAEKMIGERMARPRFRRTGISHRGNPSGRASTVFTHGCPGKRSHVRSARRFPIYMQPLLVMAGLVPAIHAAPL